VTYPGSPFPVESGGSIRYWNLLLALRSLGDVDVWLIDEPDAARAAMLEAELGAGRVHADRPVTMAWTPKSDLEWGLRSRLPRWPVFDLEGIRRRFVEWSTADYDVVLSADAMCFELLGRFAPGRQSWTWVTSPIESSHVSCALTSTKQVLASSNLAPPIGSRIAR
jgi:hypothetical protein